MNRESSHLFGAICLPSGRFVAVTACAKTINCSVRGGGFFFLVCEV